MHFCGGGENERQNGQCIFYMQDIFWDHRQQEQREFPELPYIRRTLN